MSFYFVTVSEKWLRLAFLIKSCLVTEYFLISPQFSLLKIISFSTCKCTFLIVPIRKFLCFDSAGFIWCMLIQVLLYYTIPNRMSLFISGWSTVKLFKSLDKPAQKESSLKFLKHRYLVVICLVLRILLLIFLVKHMGKMITYGKGWYKTFYYIFWVCEVNVINNSRA